MDNKKIKAHFVGKDKFYFDEDPAQKDLDRQLEKVIDQYILKLAASGEYMNIPRLTPEEREIIKVGIVLQLLLEQGATEDEIKALIDESKAMSEEMLKEAEQHKKLYDQFKIMESPKTDPENISN